MSATPIIQAPPEKLRRLRELQARAARIKAPIARYYDDPVGFAADCINWQGDGLAAYQQEIIGELPSRKRISVRGPHGLGKGTIASVTILWFALTRDAAGVDWKIPTTAGSWHQLVQYLWPELHKWAGRLRWDKVRDGRPFSRASELQNLNLRLAHGSAFAGASANAALIEGAHADSLLFVYDEAKAIPAATFDACEGALGGTGEAFALTLSTPGPPSGRFYDIQSRRPGYEDWHARHVTLDEAMAAGRISPDWAQQRRRQWGPESAIYVNRVLGEFHAGDEDSVIPLAWAEAAVARWLEWDLAGRPGMEMAYPRTAGVDVARFGQDKTVIAIRNGPVLTELRKTAKEDTMRTTGRVKGVLDADPARTAIVDVIGIGAGVVDRLREQDCKVQAFNASAGTDRRDSSGEMGFVNCLTGDARVLPIGDLVRIYRSPYEGPLFKVKMASGDHFTATPNHQVLTLHGWVAVQSLRTGDKLCNPSAGVAAPAGVRPEVNDMPAKLSEVYRAADVVFGSERVQCGAVNFHGDRPMGEVDVVTIDRQLLAADPAGRQLSEDALLFRPLVLARSFTRDGALAHRLGRPGCRERPPLPGDGVPRRPLGALLNRHPVPGEIVGLGDGARHDPVIPEHPVDHAFMVAESGSERVDRLPSEVAAHNLRFVNVSGAREPVGLGRRAQFDVCFAEYAADHVQVDVECLGQGVERVTGHVPAEDGGGIHVGDGCEPGGLDAASWLDSAFAQNLMEAAPVSPVELAERCQRLAPEISLDEVVSVDLSSPAAHEEPFVYTLETTAGAYRSSSVVHRNCRSAAYWGLREQLDPSAGSGLCLPDDEMLLGDLTAPQWKVTSGGKIAVESKDEIAKRLGRSTDDGDAAVEAFWSRSLPHSPSARQWAVHDDLEQLTQDPAARLRARLGGHDRDSSWDSPDAWAPQDDDGRPERANVRAWR